jgi:predicted glycoside hydrolase/deacetylase ChbG (UPF0249 family)
MVEELKKLLIVTADDFGLTHGVNSGIVKAHREGVVTSASLMVNGHAFEEAVEFARNNPTLDIGLHLNLTNQPLHFAAAVVQRKIRAPELEREIRAQVEKALATGLRVTHIDGHKHVHVIPQVLKIVRRVAPEYGIRSIRPITANTPHLGLLLSRNPRSRVAIFSQYLLAKTAAAAWKLSDTADMLAPTGFYGIAETGYLDLTTLTSIINALAEGVNEIMCHPGYADEDLSKTATRLRIQRERELQLLTSPELRRLIDDADVQLISYRDLYGTDPLLDSRSAV